MTIGCLNANEPSYVTKYDKKIICSQAQLLYLFCGACVCAIGEDDDQSFLIQKRNSILLNKLLDCRDKQFSNHSKIASLRAANQPKCVSTTMRSLANLTFPLFLPFHCRISKMRLITESSNMLSFQLLLTFSSADTVPLICLQRTDKDFFFVCKSHTLRCVFQRHEMFTVQLRQLLLFIIS